MGIIKKKKVLWQLVGGVRELQPSDSPGQPSALCCLPEPAAPSLWKSRKTTSPLNQVSLTVEGSTMSGSLQRRKKSKRKWKRLWFLLKDKVLYTFTAPEDKVATESLPLQAFTVKLTERPEGEESSNVFHLYHKKTLYYTFRADNPNTAR
ncbi:hypothetical protein F7725_016649, partial [Dissostichus mawsoni]